MLKRIFQKITLYINQIDTRSLLSVFFSFYAIPSPYTTPASDTYPAVTDADILPFRYPPAGLHRCQFLLCSLPCTVPASNPLMVLQFHRTGIAAHPKPHTGDLDGNMFLPAFRSPVEDLSFQFVEVFHSFASPVAENLITLNQILNTPLVKLRYQFSKHPGTRTDHKRARQRS